MSYRCWLAFVVVVLPAVGQAQSSVARAPVPGAPAEVMAFVGVNVIPLDTERVLPAQTVVVQQGWITALGPRAKVNVPRGATRIDGTGRYLLPGLGDCHAHFGHNARDTVQAARWLALYALNGVTTIRNMDYLHDDGLSGPQLLRLRARAAAGVVLSPRISTSGPWAPNHYIGRHSATLMPRLDSVAAYVAAYQAAGYDFIKVHDELSVVVESLAVAARRVGIPVAGHAFDALNRKERIEWILALGVYNAFDHLMGYDKSVDRNQRAVWRDPGNATDVAALRAAAAATQRAGVWNCATLVNRRSNGGGKLPPIYALAVTTLHEAGAGLLLGTDALIAFHPSPGALVHQELEEFVGVGLTPYQALLTGTRNLSQYFGTLDSTGTLAVGKRADLLLLAGNPLQDVRHTRQLRGVMLGGRWLAREEIDRRLAEMGGVPLASP